MRRDDPRRGVNWIMLGSILGALGVATGAFGAHALRDTLTARENAIWQTAVQYHLVHAVVLVGVGLLADRRPSRWVTASGWLFAGGAVVFSGSLYALALTGIGILGAITPFGGISFIAGWVCLWPASSAPKRLNPGNADPGDRVETLGIGES